MRFKVKKFVDVAETTGFDVVVVVDGMAKSGEAITKWRRKREKEIQWERRNMPLGMDMLLTDAFEACGVKVLRPYNEDADDVLAALAASNGGIVLSQDSDFYRYIPAIEVSPGFEFALGRLVLENSSCTRPRSSCRSIDLSLASKAVADAWPQVCTNESQTLRGASSSSDKKCGSLHRLSRPLLAAVLHVTGVPCIRQELPEWSVAQNSVVWSTTEIFADDTHVELLHDVPGMVRWLNERDVEPIKADWKRDERLFSRNVIAADMHVKAFGGSVTKLIHRTSKSDSNKHNYTVDQ